ncbi:MAG: hypothetical protein AAFY15_15065, partial [Cyanobacteria bacterium J06648_11]
MSPLAAGRSAQQPLTAQIFFTAKPERAIDKDYRLRRDTWIAVNSLNDDQRELLRTIASRKPENVTFSGRDVDWPKFKLTFRASLNSSLLLGIAEGVEENYHLNPILYSRIVAACTGEQASNLITGSVAFEDGPTAWATLNYRYERSSVDRLSLAETELFSLRLQNGGNLIEHIAEMENHFRVFEECDEAKSEDYKIRRLLGSLGTDYEATTQVISQAMAMNMIPATFEAACE